MRNALVLAAAALFAVPASAEVFVTRDNFYFSLSRSTPVQTEAEAELQVSAAGVQTPFGAKRTSRDGDFEKQEVTVIGEPYDLTDAMGGKWRMWIRSIAGPVLVVELVRAPKLQVPTTESYRVDTITIDGEEAAPTFGALTLHVDGTYRLGPTTGRYKRDETGVTLDGTVPKTWGKGAYWVERDGLTFRYLVGKHQFEVRYRLNQNLASN